MRLRGLVEKTRKTQKTVLTEDVRIDGPRGGGELGLFQNSKAIKTTLTYAMLVRLQFTHRITKQPTQAMRDTTRCKAKQSRAKL